MLSDPILSPKDALNKIGHGSRPETLKNWDDLDPEDYSAQNYIYKKYCWLPTDFMVGEDGAVTIESYINNIHPVSQAPLYPLIVNIFSKFVPILEQVLTDTAHSREPDASFGFRRSRPMDFKIPERIQAPYSLKGRRLQAIVKMQNIEWLASRWSGDNYDGRWSVDGLANERIIATGVYFYSVENFSSKSRIEFRELLNVISEYDSWDRFEAKKIYGIEQDMDYDQQVGRAYIKQDRCLVYPNTYQHKMDLDKMGGPSKPAHIKMLYFYFVDPSTPIPSTRFVPPQQMSWRARELMDIRYGGPLASCQSLSKTISLGI